MSPCASPGPAERYRFQQIGKRITSFNTPTPTSLTFDEDVLDLRAGFDFALTDSVHFLFSAATGLRERDSEEELNYDLYFGVQFFR